jgi:hypothetical protein
MLRQHSRIAGLAAGKKSRRVARARPAGPPSRMGRAPFLEIDGQALHRIAGR